MDALVHDTAVEVQVSMDGQHFNSALPSTGGMMYTYQAAPVVSSLSPSSGPTKGSTTVRVFGTHFEGGLRYECKYAGATDDVDKVVAATYMDGDIVCETAPMGMGSMVLEVTVNGVDYSSQAVPYNVYGEPVVWGVSPTGAVTSGNTTLTIGGHALAGGSHYKCRLHGMAVNASMVASYDVVHSSIVCVSPSSASASRHTSLEVSLNGQQFSSGSVQLVLYDTPVVTSLSPSSGPVLGGTEVLVMGNHFESLSEIVCKFGERTSVAQVVIMNDTNTNVTCMSPHALDVGVTALITQDFASAIAPLVHARREDCGKPACLACTICE